MSKDPKTNAPPPGGKSESLEDLIYRPSLASSNAACTKTSPLITIPATIVMYSICAYGVFYLAKQSDAVKKVVKTIGLDLQEMAEDEPPPPPPPPPAAPAAPPAPVMKVDAPKDAPPPPPLPADSNVVPEVVPKELPKENLSMAYAGQGGASGTGVSGPVGAAGASGPAIAGASGSTAGKVVDFDFSQIKVKLQPPPPPYPPLAKIAKIQGTVVVEIVVGLDGVPTKATALEGPPQLRPTAENYAMQWRFEPALLNGQPQMARFRLTMPFKLR